jgi:hypothetical protein
MCRTSAEALAAAEAFRDRFDKLCNRAVVNGTARSTISATAFFRASLIFGQHSRRSAIGTRLSKTTCNRPEVTADALNANPLLPLG